LQKHKQWQKALERVMFKFVELCVEMNRGRFAKDGLFYYRNVCAGVNTNSLEEVIKYLLKLATDKADEAQQEAQLHSISDLETQHTPEALMSAFSIDSKAKDQRERGSEQFKFLWETYRTVLDVLRDNNKLELLYSMTANKAFAFCYHHGRTTEFRRLGDMLRRHLLTVVRRQPLQNERARPDRSDPAQQETFQILLEMRFEQLKTATSLEQWQEAFRTIEDVHTLMTSVKRTPKPNLMAVYYAKLSQIFWVSENYLHHAFAWYKLFGIARGHNKSLTEEDACTLASVVLLAAVASPPYAGSQRHESQALQAPEQDAEKERNIKMAQLLGYAIDPTRDTRDALSRSALLKDLSNKGLHSLVHDDIRKLVELLEGDQLNPLEFCERAYSLINSIEQLPKKLSSASPVQEIDWAGYTMPLQKISILRCMQQLSKIYGVLKLSTLQRIIPGSDLQEIESVILEAVRHSFLHLHIDHASSCIRFGAQRLESDTMRNHLSTLAARLNKAVKMIEPPKEDLSDKVHLPDAKDFQQQLEEEHQNALARRTYIERKKEEEERQLIMQQQQEEQKKQEALRATEEAEAKRLEEERKQREQERIRKEVEEREQQEAKQLLEQQQKKKGKKAKVTDEDKLDKKQLMQDALQEQIKERQDMEKKLNKQAKQLDHFERAKREEEAPLIQEHYRKMLEDDREYLQRIQQEQEAQHKKAWEVDLKEKHRLAKMEGDRNTFESEVMQQRREQYAKEMEDYNEQVKEIKEARKAERDAKRREEWLRRLQTAEQRMKAAHRERQRQHEEEEREKRRREQEAAQQRQQEQQKQQQDQQAAVSSGGGKYTPPSRRQKDSQPGSNSNGSPAPAAPPARAPPAAAATGRGRAGPGGGFSDVQPPSGASSSAGRGPPASGGGFTDRQPQRGGALSGPGGRGAPPHGGGRGDGLEDRQPPPRRADDQGSRWR
jgi:translation initiation factor 3 subunit A